MKNATTFDNDIIWNEEQIKKFAQDKNLNEQHIRNVLDFNKRYDIKPGTKVFFDFDRTLTDVHTWEGLNLTKPDSFEIQTESKKKEITDICFPRATRQQLRTTLEVEKALNVDCNINSNQHSEVIQGMLKYIDIHIDSEKIYGRQPNKTKSEKIRHLLEKEDNIVVVDDDKTQFDGFTKATCIEAKKPILDDLIGNTAKYDLKKIEQTAMSSEQFQFNPTNNSLMARRLAKKFLTVDTKKIDTDTPSALSQIVPPISDEEHKHFQFTPHIEAIEAKNINRYESWQDKKRKLEDAPLQPDIIQDPNKKQKTIASFLSPSDPGELKFGIKRILSSQGGQTR